MVHAMQEHQNAEFDGKDAPNVNYAIPRPVQQVRVALGLGDMNPTFFLSPQRVISPRAVLVASPFLASQHRLHLKSSTLREKFGYTP